MDVLVAEIGVARFDPPCNQRGRLKRIRGERVGGEAG
jgi:hypothetical protein